MKSKFFFNHGEYILWWSCSIPSFWSISNSWNRNSIFLQPWRRYSVIIMLNSFIILEYFRYSNSKLFHYVINLLNFFISDSKNSNFSSTVVKTLCNKLAQFLHSGAFQIVKIQIFPQPLWRHEVINLLNFFILKHFRYLKGRKLRVYKFSRQKFSRKLIFANLKKIREIRENLFSRNFPKLRNSRNLSQKFTYMEHE